MNWDYLYLESERLRSMIPSYCISTPLTLYNLKGTISPISLTFIPNLTQLAEFQFLVAFILS